MRRQWQGSINLVRPAHSSVGTGEKYNILTYNYACLTSCYICAVIVEVGSGCSARPGITMPRLCDRIGSGPLHPTTLGLETA